MPSKHEVFKRAWEIEHKALGYDDLSMRTERLSDVDYDQVDLTSQVTTNVRLKNPVMIAPMSAISSVEMAIEVEKGGASDFIHHSVDPDEQKRRVREIKLHLNGRIDNPTLIQEEERPSDVLQMLEQENRNYRTLPIVDSEGRFRGIVTGNHFELFREELNSSSMAEIMTPADELQVMDDSIESESDHDMHMRAYGIIRDKKIKMLPVLDEDGRVQSLYLSEGLLRVVRGNPEEYSLDKDGRFLTFASVPANSEEAVERLKKMEKYLDVVTIDTSHGESTRAISTISALKAYLRTTKAIKENFSSIDVMVGNISTAQTALELAKYEPDAIKVGQGPGQICVTSDRLKIGTPQAQAVYEVAEAFKKAGVDIPLCADGGIKDSGHAALAFALGASSVMVGSLVAGTDEQPVPVMTDDNGVSYKEYWGEASEKAQRLYLASRQRYMSEEITPPRIIFAEGKVKKVPLKGPVADVLEERMMGIRASLGSQGFKNIAELQDGVSLMRGSN